MIDNNPKKERPVSQRPPQAPAAEEILGCVRCLKLPELCCCAFLPSLKTQLEVLILQHPQEPDRQLGTGKITQLSLQNAQLKIGLSWPHLKGALGREVNAAQWGVLYLGSGLKVEGASGSGAGSGGSQSQGARKKAVTAAASGLVTSKHLREQEGSTEAVVVGRSSSLRFVNKKGQAISAPKTLTGIVVLDGSWSQAKTLWWRNPWLLKLQRVLLQPARPSLYGKLRKEPRKECLSTLEAVSEALVHLGEPATISQELETVFLQLLHLHQLHKKSSSSSKTRAQVPAL